MSWDEKKLGKKYFYLSVRDGERTSKRYLGNGVPSCMAANRMALHRAEKKAQADTWRAAVARWDDIKLFRDQLLAGVHLLTSATLLAAGFHQASRHRWRRRRNV